MQLSVLDQSPIISGHTPSQAVVETLRLASYELLAEAFDLRLGTPRGA